MKYSLIKLIDGTCIYNAEDYDTRIQVNGYIVIKSGTLITYINKRHIVMLQVSEQKKYLYQLIKSLEKTADTNDETWKDKYVYEEKKRNSELPRLQYRMSGLLRLSEDAERFYKPFDESHSRTEKGAIMITVNSTGADRQAQITNTKK